MYNIYKTAYIELAGGRNVFKKTEEQKQLEKEKQQEIAKYECKNKMSRFKTDFNDLINKYNNSFSHSTKILKNITKAYDNITKFSDKIPICVDNDNDFNTKFKDFKKTIEKHYNDYTNLINHPPTTNELFTYKLTSKPIVGLPRV